MPRRLGTLVRWGMPLLLACANPFDLDGHRGDAGNYLIGKKKFAYDIWGDTVNIAARVETAGEAGRINVSETTYALIKNEIECEHRSRIHAKNKGEIDMYYVTPRA